MTAAGDRLRGDRLLEVLAVLLLAVSTLGSAWCAYQSAQWNDVETDEARESATARIEASRLFALATQTLAYDASSAAQYAGAVAAGDERLAEFLREAVIRPAFLPEIEAWEAAVRAGEDITNITQDQEDLATRLAPSRAEDERAAAADVRRDEAGDHAQEYVLLTLLMASALFFAGVTSSFRARLVRVMLIAASGVTIALVAAQLVDLPVA